MEEGYCACKVKCNICTYEWTATFKNGIAKLECPHCTLMVDFEIIEDLIKKANEKGSAK